MKRICSLALTLILILGLAGCAQKAADAPTWQEHKDEELCLYRIAKQAGCKFYLGSDAHMQEKMLRIVEVLPEVVEALGLTDADRFCLE